MMSNLIAVSCVVSLSICATEGGPQELGRDSPELAFATYKTSLAKEDWQSLYSVLSSGCRDYLIFETLFSLGMRSGANKKEADKIYAKYVDEQKVERLADAFKQELTAQQRIDLFAQAIEDKKGMFVESYTYLSGLRRNTPKGRFGPLFGLRVSKDAATARTKHTSTVVSYSNAGRGSPDIRNEEEVTSETAVYFIKVNGKWLFATEDEWRQRKIRKPESPEDADKQKK